MDFVWNTNVIEVLGDGNKVTGVKVKNNETNEESVVETSGVFIYVGLLPMTEPFKNLNITDESGWIVTNDQMETSVPGIYAIGDVRQKDLRQITTAVGEGGIAGQQAFKYIEALSSKAPVTD
ncbi:thioredoxin reductase [Lentilactobacillus kosonis]|uniref:Thioredoxin reductase n=1 Tax=Lentilactobacillus kosonis TaxID=2810561 RepID=A0A401FK01_9LACO|nr:thioredoxin reductase [Lentilactobacillus kosonis]